MAGETQMAEQKQTAEEMQAAAQVREISFPFNAVEGADGIPDRIYDAEDFARYWGAILTSGVYMDKASSLKVEGINDNMVATVRPGIANLEGYGYSLMDDYFVTMSESHPVYMRKDAVVLRLDLTERWIKVLYREGVAAASPVLPELIRTADIYELRLAEITVKSGVTKITQADILDTRLNNAVCGQVAVRPLHADTTGLFNQYQTYLNQQIAAWNATKAQQGADWQAQMGEQEGEFNKRQTDIQAWYQQMKANINTRQALDFDDICALPGTTNKTEFLGADILATATLVATGKTLATNRTTFPVDGSIKETLTVYAEDGQAVLKTQVKTTTFNADGSIQEVIA